MVVETKKTRFVCISDTHNSSPVDGVFKLPKGDVLIHAGDLTKQGTLEELRRTLTWIDKADFEVKIVIAGNHDITLDKGFYDQHGQYFHNQHPQDPETCVSLVREYRSITFLNHETVKVKLEKEGGPKTSFRVFGSPWSPANGLWAFGYPPEKASTIWDDSIPLDTDIVITHTPPKYHCDESKDRGAAGCEFLRQKLWRVRPLLAVCGHVHEGRGTERVLWDLEAPNVKYKELLTGYWTDRERDTKKQSLIDLTAKSAAPLRNSKEGTNIDAAAAELTPGEPKTGASSMPWTFRTQPSYQHVDGSHPAVWGQGGTPPSGRCDVEALNGRLGRQETCIINASILASSWPYTKSKNDRRYNKPIVVDIDLPVRPVRKEGIERTQSMSGDNSMSENTNGSSEDVYYSVSS